MAGGNQENEHRENGSGSDSTEQTSEGTASEQISEGTASEGTGPAGLDCVDESVDDEYLEELPDGSGCVEIWEHLADRRGDQG